MRALARVIVLVALAILVTGCAGDPSAQPVADWTFVGPDGERAPVTLPAHLGAHLPWARTRYALVTTVAIDPAWRGRDLTLVLPRFLALVKLRADGAEAPALFQDASGYRGKGPHAWRIPAAATEDGTVDLELDVEHTWTMSAWLDSTPRLTTALDGGPAFVRQRAFDDTTSIAAFCCALFAGYLYLAIYLTDRRRSTYGWFALTGLGGCLYPLFQSALVARVLGPFETLMAGIGVGTATVAQVYFTASHFGLPRPSRWWGVAWAASSVLVLGSIGYFRSTPIGGTATVAVAAPALFSQVVLFARLLVRRPRPPNLFTVLGGWALLGVLGIPDFAAWLGVGEPFEGLRTASLGVFLVAFLTTATISQSLTRSLRHADELAAEREERIRQLETQKREVELLNDELRRQIAARSRALADAITHLSVAAETKGDRVLVPGDVIDDRYTVVRELGSGAAGNVYLVERRTDGAQLAMKVVRSTSDRTLLARLAREAQLAVQVKHENVITVVDVEVAQTGFLYIVMEYVSGDSLKEHKAEYGRVAWALDVLRQIAAGLASVHERGIVHRDLKPANVLLVPRAGQPPLVKIADFGIAGLAGEEELVATVKSRPPADSRSQPRVQDDLELTQTGVLMGTPLYMAPETIGGAKNAAPSVDLFSFGVIAFELLTGAPPFRDSPALAQLRGVAVPPAPPLATLCAPVLGEISNVIDRCVSFEADDRPTAREVLAVLERSSVKLAV